MMNEIDISTGLVGVAIVWRGLEKSVKQFRAEGITNMLREQLVIGDRIIVRDEIDLGPYAIIAAGETGQVTAVDDDETTITLDTFHAGLVAYCGANVLWILSGCIDVLDRISLLVGTHG